MAKSRFPWFRTASAASVSTGRLTASEGGAVIGTVSIEVDKPDLAVAPAQIWVKAVGQYLYF